MAQLRSNATSQGSGKAAETGRRRMMGYTTVSTSILPQDMPQTQSNVARVLDFSGWTYTEASEQIGVSRYLIMDAMMPDDKWRLLLDKAGRRSFDHDEDAA